MSSNRNYGLSIMQYSTCFAIYNSYRRFLTTYEAKTTKIL